HNHLNGGLSMTSNVSSLQEMHKKIFQNPSQEFVYYRTYSRWLDEFKRREFYPETVSRYLSFLQTNLKTENPIPAKVWKKMESYMISLGTMPSMRAFWAAGSA